jgi:hypothetical protein
VPLGSLVDPGSAVRLACKDSDRRGRVPRDWQCFRDIWAPQCLQIVSPGSIAKVQARDLDPKTFSLIVN